MKICNKLAAHPRCELIWENKKQIWESAESLPLSKGLTSNVMWLMSHSLLSLIIGFNVIGKCVGWLSGDAFISCYVKGFSNISNPS